VIESEGEIQPIERTVAFDQSCEASIRRSTRSAILVPAEPKILIG
jgi:hypothetical protein